MITRRSDGETQNMIVVKLEKMDQKNVVIQCVFCFSMTHRDVSIKNRGRNIEVYIYVYA